MIDDTVRNRVREAVAEALGDAYDCTRVWAAWSYGTMSDEDFTLVREDESRVAEIADAAIAAMAIGETPVAEDGQSPPAAKPFATVSGPFLDRLLSAAAAGATPSELRAQRIGVVAAEAGVSRETAARILEQNGAFAPDTTRSDLLEAARGIDHFLEAVAKTGIPDVSTDEVDQLTTRLRALRERFAQFTHPAQ